jgi:riboflavin kinase / FMN adenylyltransferase
MTRNAADGCWLPPNVTGAAVTVGTFDGVHIGHADLLNRLVAQARAANLASVVVTFTPHPTEVLRPGTAPLLLTPGYEKCEALATVGVDYCAVLPFNSALASLTATEFVRDVLQPRFLMRALTIGHDHGFGRDRAGGRDLLMSLGASDGFSVLPVEPVRLPDGGVVSSSTIRRAVVAGDLAAASAALGRRYSLHGVVQRGDQRGRQIGFPTINLGAPVSRKLLPPDGVYAAIAQTPSGAVGAMLNLGARPTVGDPKRTVEAHLLDFSGDLYGVHVRLDLVSRLRGVTAFDGLPSLVRQLEFDREASRTALTPFL